MILTTIGPSYIQGEQQPVNINEKQIVENNERAQKLKVEQQLSAAQAEQRSAERKKQIDQQLEDNNRPEERFVMSEYNIKQLLFLMSSKGTTESVKQIVEQLKREKELMDQKL